MTELLNDEQVAAALAGLPRWRQDGNAIARTAQLPSFLAGIAAVGRIAGIAEARDHHPDIDIRWRNLTFRCATHSAGGITAKDVELARSIDEVIDTVLTESGG